MATKVNVPVDPKTKERDVNTKLQLYGIYAAFANGKVPSNQQIDVALNSFLETKMMSKPSQRLSPEGQRLVKEFRTVVEQAKQLLLSKNHGDLLQDFIWQCEQLDGGVVSTTPNAPVDKETAKQHGQDALQGLRTLGTLIITNGQFRKLLEDAGVLLRSIGSDAATNAAGKLGPNEQRLNQIDDPAPDNTWHEAPDLSKDKVRDMYNKNKPFNKADLKDAAGDASQEAHPAGSRDPAATANLAANDAQTGGASGVNAASGVGAGVGNLRDTASQNLPEDTKRKADELKEKTQERRARLNDYLKGKMPEERREQTIWRLKKMVVEIQGHQDYLSAVDTLLNLAEQYGGHSKNLVGQGKDTVKDARSHGALSAAEADLKTLIERFANGTSLDPLVESINQIYRDADQDPELRDWFRKMDTYIRRCLKEQGYIMEDASTEQWNRLYDQGHALLREKYRGHTDHIIDEFKHVGRQFDADPQNQAFAESVRKLCLSLGQDESGKAAFKPHLLKDLSEVIVPAAFENIRYVPIPRIEYQDPMMNAVVENLVLEGDNLAPNVFEFTTDNHFKWGRKKIQSSKKNRVVVKVSGIQADLRDVAYYVKKKQGFPSITDQGVMDIHLGGDGFSFKLDMETADSGDSHHFFKINKVDVQVKNFNIKVKQSKHKLLFTLAKPLLLKVIRPALQKVAEKQIKENAAQLDQLLHDIKVEADRAQAEFKRNPDPENAKNIYQRYADAANRKIMQGKKKKAELQERAKDTKVNMAVTQHDSIFPNIKLPGGISSKATEYKELARKGDKWQSPVFSLGSAKESSNLPGAPTVSRKTAGTATHGSTQPLTNGAAGLSSQLDRAFDGTANTTTTNGFTNGNTTKLGSSINGSATNTTLGEANPVLTGSV